jgi:hypothetical protein
MFITCGLEREQHGFAAARLVQSVGTRFIGLLQLKNNGLLHHSEQRCHYGTKLFSKLA